MMVDHEAAFIVDDCSLLMITEACNSNCIMCPMSEDSRKRGRTLSKCELTEKLENLDESVYHLDITGGEPFLQWELVLQAMQMINERHQNVQVLILTNGRALSIPFLQEKIRPLLTRNYRFAIPIHADKPEIHDAITQTKGSFFETISALQFLSTTNASIEIRIVCHQINKDHIKNTSIFLCQNGLRIAVVNFIAMEMNGTAARNRNKLWINYRDIFKYVEPGIQQLVKYGIDVGLYDFPLCSVPSKYWSIAKKSITDWKVRYAPECEECMEKEACGGLFRSTFLLDLYAVKPIKR